MVEGGRRWCKGRFTSPSTYPQGYSKLPEGEARRTSASPAHAGTSVPSIVIGRYTTAGGMEDVGRGPRFSPTAKVGEDGRTKKIVSSQIKMVKDEISTILTKHKGAAGFSIPEGFDKLDMMAQFQIMQKTSKDVLGYLKNTQTPQAQRDFATLSKRYGQLTSLVNRGLGVEGEADTPEWERYAQ